MRQFSPSTALFNTVQLLPKQRPAAHSTAMDDHAVTYRNAVFQGKSVTMNHRPFLDVHIFANDYGVGSVTADRHTGPDAGILANLNVSDDISKLAHPSRLRNLGCNAVKSTDQADLLET